MYQRFHLGHGRNHSVGEIVDQTDQEVPGPHGRVADFELKNLLDRVERCEPHNRSLALRPVCWHSPGFRLEDVHGHPHQGFDGFLDDQDWPCAKATSASRNMLIICSEV